jgi:hypothetical protein
MDGVSTRFVSAEYASDAPSLESRALLVLQLAARGSSPQQIDTVLEHLALREEAHSLLVRVARRLGADDVTEAIDVARRRGLIV